MGSESLFIRLTKDEEWLLSQLAALAYAETCIVCHQISGEGGRLGPDLTRVGAKRDRASLRSVIEDASQVFGDTDMPTFRNRLTPEQIGALVTYLEARR